MIEYIVLFIGLGFFLGLFLEEEMAMGWIIVLTIGWAFIMGPWAIATFVELFLGFSIAKGMRRQKTKLLE